MPTSNRISITIKELYKRPDLQGYMYSKERAEYCLDPWITITGIDKFTGFERYIIQYGTAERIVGENYIVYVQK